ncbi:conserved hypothetical protein [Flavobacterium sp. 9AF]|uniref:hypothetical protein n=1 Tax=Flavobacterium sp. 9AF TaxID=2653142 RepID=UPI0012F1C78C|nr:hypothetical protein [Flavobacterium sp. 9AF]VXB62469.1 conserved hypothetical protein [Flavobacterium sp. 9AF]
MKRKLFILLIIFSITPLFSQKLTKDELKTKLAELTCKCSEDKELTKDNYELALGLCILEAVNKHQADVEKHYGKDYISKIEQIGGDVGEKVAVVCPNLLMQLIDHTGSDDTEDVTYQDEEIEGSFVNTNIEGFLFLNLKETSGKSHQFVLINNFDNSYLIVDKLLKANDKIKVYYFLAELYNAKTNKYESFKIISDIQKL